MASRIRIGPKNHFPIDQDCGSSFRNVLKAERCESKLAGQVCLGLALKPDCHAGLIAIGKDRVGVHRLRSGPGSGVPDSISPAMLPTIRLLGPLLVSLNLA